MSATAPSRSGPPTVSLADEDGVGLIREHHGRWLPARPGFANPPEGGR
jgi:hypothetical protein